MYLGVYMTTTAKIVETLSLGTDCSKSFSNFGQKWSKLGISGTQWVPGPGLLWDPDPLTSTNLDPVSQPSKSVESRIHAHMLVLFVKLEFDVERGKNR